MVTDVLGQRETDPGLCTVGAAAALDDQDVVRGQLQLGLGQGDVPAGWQIRE